MTKSPASYFRHGFLGLCNYGVTWILSSGLCVYGVNDLVSFIHSVSSSLGLSPSLILFLITCKNIFCLVKLFSSLKDLLANLITAQLCKCYCWE